MWFIACKGGGYEVVTLLWACAQAGTVCFAPLCPLFLLFHLPASRYGMLCSIIPIILIIPIIQGLSRGSPGALHAWLLGLSRGVALPRLSRLSSSWARVPIDFKFLSSSPSKTGIYKKIQEITVESWFSVFWARKSRKSRKSRKTMKINENNENQERECERDAG